VRFALGSAAVAAQLQLAAPCAVLLRVGNDTAAPELLPSTFALPTAGGDRQVLLLQGRHAVDLTHPGGVLARVVAANAATPRERFLVGKLLSLTEKMAGLLGGMNAMSEGMGGVAGALAGVAAARDRAAAAGAGDGVVGQRPASEGVAGADGGGGGGEKDGGGGAVAVLVLVGMLLATNDKKKGKRRCGAGRALRKAGTLTDD
jgi:hypothetical protein